MDSRLALRPDLSANALEDRTLPAAFIDSTFFQFSFTSGTSPFQYSPAGAGSFALADPGLAAENGTYAGNFAAGSGYFGFGNNAFGAGLSPLDGVVEAYSMNTALSDLVGAGSSLPGDGSLGDGFRLPVPGSPSASVLGDPASRGEAGAINGPRGYGSAMSSGFNFSLSSANNFGMSPSGVGVSARTTGGPDRSPVAPASEGKGDAPTSGATGQGPGVTRQGPRASGGNLGQGAADAQSRQAPSRRDESPDRATTPAPAQPPARGRGGEADGPAPVAPPQRPSRPVDAPADPDPEAGGEALLRDEVIRVPSAETP